MLDGLGGELLPQPVNIKTVAAKMPQRTNSFARLNLFIAPLSAQQFFQCVGPLITLSANDVHALFGVFPDFTDLLSKVERSQDSKSKGIGGARKGCDFAHPRIDIFGKLPDVAFLERRL